MESLLSLWSFSNWAFILIGTAVALYLYGTRNYAYFSKHKIPHNKPYPFVGTTGPVLLRRLSLPDYIQKLYNETKGHPYAVTFEFTRHIVMIRDPELIKAVTVKDFEHFTDHREIVSAEMEPLWGKGLFNLKGQRWRDMRSTLSPAFTSSKMKTMFVLVAECGKQLSNFLEKCCENYIPDKICKIEKENDLLVVEMKDLFTRYTNDVIATAAFGVGVDSLMEPSDEFYLMGKDITNFGVLHQLVIFGYILCYNLMKMLNFHIIPSRATNFFRALVHDTMKTRDHEGIVRPDLIKLLMQAKKGTLQDERSPARGKTVLDDDLAAQAFLFFLAGFDSVATLLCFASHQLAAHPDVQARLQEEIDSTLGSTDHITYEAVQSMKYLDMVLSETLRLYPVAPAVDRRCNRAYTIPAEPPLEISPGDYIWIPIYGIHRDPEYFPDPERFDPERFSDENKHNIKQSTYLPFGFGPRVCIGSRFALMEAKTAMVHLLSRFNLKVVSRTPIPTQISKNGFGMTVDKGF